jgi:hypothetical protein
LAQNEQENNPLLPITLHIEIIHKIQEKNALKILKKKLKLDKIIPDT